MKEHYCCFFHSRDIHDLAVLLQNWKVWRTPCGYVFRWLGGDGQGKKWEVAP